MDQREENDSKGKTVPGKLKTIALQEVEVRIQNDVIRYDYDKFSWEAMDERKMINQQVENQLQETEYDIQMLRSEVEAEVAVGKAAQEKLKKLRKYGRQLDKNVQETQEEFAKEDLERENLEGLLKEIKDDDLKLSKFQGF